MAVSTRTRFEVFKRDKFTCQYCGRTPPTVILHVDHVVATANGGTDAPINLVTACQDCNLGKSDVPLDQVTRPLADQIAEAKERREQVEAFNQFLADARADEDDAIETLGVHWFHSFMDGEWVFGSSSRINSIRTFLRRLPFERIKEAMDIAESRISVFGRDDNKRWRYFCGVCWNMIREAEGR